MTMQWLELAPVDTWFFRDGRPYNQGEANQTGVASDFPPPPPTLVGALRAALARANGWNGRGSWPEDLKPLLGDGPKDLGALSFCGPLLAGPPQPGGAPEPLFPAPACLLGKPAPTADDHGEADPKLAAVTLLAPGKKAHSDLGQVAYPEPQASGEGWKPLDGYWITRAGLDAVLAGRTPPVETLLPPARIYKQEPRVGLERDHAKRTTGEGALYSPAHVRLQPDFALLAGLTVKDQALPTDWPPADALIPLGGESRLASVSQYDKSRPVLPDLAPETQRVIRNAQQFTLTLLTPGDWGHAENNIVTWPRPGDALPDLPGACIVSACMERPVWIGGWDSIRREPLALRPYLPAGTTFFCEATGDADLDAILNIHGQALGGRVQHGFGRVAVGAWPTTATDVKE